MKVLVITEHYWPEQFRITDLARGLRGRGHDVDVLAAMPNYPQGRYFDGYRPWRPLVQYHEGVRVLRVPVIPRRSGRGWELLLNYGSYAAMAALRLLFARGQRWDVSLVFQPSPVTTALPALLLRALRNVPVAIWVQDLWPQTLTAVGALPKGPLLSAAGWLSHALYRSCDRVIGQSRAFLPGLRKAGVRDERLAYVPNWAEDVYSGSAAGVQVAEEAQGIFDREFNVVFAGNLGRVQALETVLSASALLREDSEIKWVLVGDGVRRSWVEAEAKRLRIEQRVVLVGQRPMEAMPFYFKHASALLVSLKPDDVMSLTVPSKVQSYLAAGRPILASIDGEGARVVEEAGAGLVSSAGDAVGLAENVRRLKAMSIEERERIGKAGRRYYDLHFDRSVCLSAFEDILFELGGKKREPRMS